MKLVCGTSLAPPGWYCSRPVNHEGSCAAHPVIHNPATLKALVEQQALRSCQDKGCPEYGTDHVHIRQPRVDALTPQTPYDGLPLRTQSRKASLAEAVANTFIGFIISWCATLTCMWLLDIHMSFSQLWWYTWFMTGISIVRGYALRRAWNAEWWKRFKRSHL